jgi:hypothetical protein
MLLILLNLFDLTEKDLSKYLKEESKKNKAKKATLIRKITPNFNLIETLTIYLEEPKSGNLEKCLIKWEAFLELHLPKTLINFSKSSTLIKSKTLKIPQITREIHPKLKLTSEKKNE